MRKPAASTELPTRDALWWPHIYLKRVHSRALNVASTMVLGLCAMFSHRNQPSAPPPPIVTLRVRKMSSNSLLSHPAIACSDENAPYLPLRIRSNHPSNVAHTELECHTSPPPTTAPARLHLHRWLKHQARTVGGRMGPPYLDFRTAWTAEYHSPVVVVISAEGPPPIFRRFVQRCVGDGRDGE